MDIEESNPILGSEDLEEIKRRHHAYLDPQSAQITVYLARVASIVRSALSAKSSRQIRKRAIITATVLTTFFLLSPTLFHPHSQTTANNGIWPITALSPDSPPPFTGAFSRFPRISELPARQRRLTIIGVWSDNTFPSYLRHFFYTMQMNADVLDLVMINRVKDKDNPCIDFEQVKADITWGANIHFYCMPDEEWKKRHVDYLCSKEDGWNCNATEYEAVTKEFAKRPDTKNFNWRPLRGYVFRDLLPNPDYPFWGWMDHDMSVGNFRHYPFNILSQVSFLTGSQGSPESIWMAGQLTAFNLDDKALATAWKKFPEMQSANHFTNYNNGPMPESAEEEYWSFGYMGSKVGPGKDLSWAMYSDLQGDDFYQNNWNHHGANTVYVISGREVLLVSTAYTRKEIEDLIRIERRRHVDDLGGMGWTGGVDGSAEMVKDFTMSDAEAKNLAVKEAALAGESEQMHTGILEDQLILTECPVRDRYKDISQCLHPHPLTTQEMPIMRASLVHFKEQLPGHVIRRLELDQRPRGFERKLFKHILKAKRFAWFELPGFEIKEDMVLRYNSDGIEVFNMGLKRDKTIFQRGEKVKPIG